jgi:hypothetical protein
MRHPRTAVAMTTFLEAEVFAALASLFFDSIASLAIASLASEKSYQSETSATHSSSLSAEHFFTFASTADMTARPYLGGYGAHRH